MIVDLFRGPLDWFISLTESVSAIAAILLIGLVIGTTSFWILGRFVRRLAGPPAELELEDDELNEGPAEPPPDL